MGPRGDEGGEGGIRKGKGSEGVEISAKLPKNWFRAFTGLLLQPRAVHRRERSRNWPRFGEK
jgi:hypothetical protein